MKFVRTSLCALKPKRILIAVRAARPRRRSGCHVLFRAHRRQGLLCNNESLNAYSISSNAAHMPFLCALLALAGIRPVVCNICKRVLSAGERVLCSRKQQRHDDPFKRPDDVIGLKKRYFPEGLPLFKV